MVDEHPKCRILRAFILFIPGAVLMSLQTVYWSQLGFSKDYLYTTVYTETMMFLKLLRL